jgi:hypothetical protein
VVFLFIPKLLLATAAGASAFIATVAGAVADHDDANILWRGEMGGAER